MALPKKYNPKYHYFSEKQYNKIASKDPRMQGSVYLQSLPIFRDVIRIRKKKVYPAKSYAAPIDVEKYVKEALNTPFPTDSRVKAATDLTSPSAAAALAYMKKVPKDGLCGLPAEKYLENILQGNTKEVANAEATRAYINNYNNGERLPTTGACAAADVAWREAWGKEDDPVIDSAFVFHQCLARS